MDKNERPDMTLAANAQIRSDLDTADRIVNTCRDNFKATEPAFVLRDLIAIEIANAREAEREACAKIAETEPFIEARGSEFDDGVVFASRGIADAIRNRKWNYAKGDNGEAMSHASVVKEAFAAFEDTSEELKSL